VILDPGPLDDVELDAPVAPTLEGFDLVATGEPFPEQAVTVTSSTARSMATEKQRGGTMRQRARFELKPR